MSHAEGTGYTEYNIEAYTYCSKCTGWTLNHFIGNKGIKSDLGWRYSTTGNTVASRVDLPSKGQRTSSVGTRISSMLNQCWKVVDPRLSTIAISMLIQGYVPTGFECHTRFCYYTAAALQILVSRCPWWHVVKCVLILQPCSTTIIKCWTFMFWGYDKLTFQL